MSGEVLIDIVLPYYSPSKRAWPAIESVLAQTYAHWRLVVVDDAYPEEGIRERLRLSRILVSSMCAMTRTSVSRGTSAGVSSSSAPNISPCSVMTT